MAKKAHQYPTKEEITKRINEYKATQTKHWLLEKLLTFIIKNTEHSDGLPANVRRDRAIRALWGNRNKGSRGNSMDDYDSFYIFEMAHDMVHNHTNFDVAAWDAAYAILGKDCDSKKVERKKNRLMRKFPVGLMVDYDHTETRPEAIREIKKQDKLHLFAMGCPNLDYLKEDVKLIKRWIRSWDKKVDKTEYFPKKSKIQTVTK